MIPAYVARPVDMFEAVIFDFDGVILDSEPIHYEACCQIFHQIGFNFSYPEYIEKCLGRPDKDIFPHLLASKGFNFSSKEIDYFINQKIEGFSHIINTRHNLPIVSHVDQYIAQIVKEMKKIAICTGSSKKEITIVLSKLKSGALKAYFNTIITADDVHHGKPSPEGYLLTAKRLKVAPEKCIVIEDSPYGIDAAKAAGMYVIAVPTTHNKEQLHKADRMVANFADLLG